MRVLVTGANGFIGRHVLVPLIARGGNVHAVGRTVIDTADVTSHVADLMDQAAVAAVVQAVRPTHLLHLAWCTTPGLYWTARENLDWVAASLHLCRCFIDSGGKRMVVAGSCAEYDWSVPLLDERTTPCIPTTLYGMTKNALHHLLREAARLEGISLAWGRVHFLYGPGEKPGRLVSTVATALWDGDVVSTTAGTQIRDFMHVVDGAGAFAALCDSTVTGPINIATGIARPVREIIERLGMLSGRADLLRIGGRPSPAGEPPRLDVSVARLTEEVGFRPRFDLASGLADTMEWWRQKSFMRIESP